MKRKPYRRAMKEPIVICMCATSYCLGEFDGASNSCPIKCLKSCDTGKKSLVKEMDTAGGASLSDPISKIGMDATAGSACDDAKFERYEFVGNPIKLCSCPICSCNCNFACTIKDVPKLMLRKRQNEHVEYVRK